MLLEFGFRNFFGFKDGVSISFRFDSNVPEQFSNGSDVATAICVKGANGAGKTCVIRGLAFLSYFVNESFERSPDHPIPISSFYGSKEPIDLYAEFRLKNEEFRYELSLMEKEVVSETIYRTKKRQTKILERKGEKITYSTGEFEGLEAIKLRKNASVVSVAHQYELPQLAAIHKFFRTIHTNVTYHGLRRPPLDLSAISKRLKADPIAFEFVKSFIRECDVGIKDIDIISYMNASVENSSKDAEIFVPVFFHGKKKGELGITDKFESSGTKTLFGILKTYKQVLDAGGILALDEFDMHLHSHILPKLLDLFLDPSKNRKKAQILFTTHNSEILELMGRYRTYLVNKDDNESYVYRLDEIPGDILRNDRPIAPVYNDGRIGGVPRL